MTKMQVNKSVLELLETKMKGMIDNEAKKLANEARTIALQERAMALAEKRAKDKGDKVEARPSTSAQSLTQEVVKVAGPGGEPRLMTNMQPVTFNFGPDNYPFEL